MDETMEGQARRHKKHTHGWTWTEPWDEDARKDSPTTPGRDHGASTRTGTKVHTHRHGRNHGRTSTTTQETHIWMDMDGTMGRRRTQRLANDTWVGPWYEYEDEDEDEDADTHT